MHISYTDLHVNKTQRVKKMIIKPCFTSEVVNRYNDNCNESVHKKIRQCDTRTQNKMVRMKRIHALL